MIRICTSLANAGYDVLLIGRKLKNSQPLVQQPFQQKRMFLFFQNGKLFYIEYNIHLFFKLLFSNFDIVCGVDLDSILPCYFAAKLKGKKKLVYDAHELFTDTPEVYQRKIIRKIWLAVEQFIIPKTDLRYTVSKSIAEEFEKRYGYHFDLIRNLPIQLRITNYELRITKLTNQQSTINANQHLYNEPWKGFKPFQGLGIQTTTTNLVYLGNLNEGRGVEIAIEALKYLDNSVHLWIIGDGDLRSTLETQVKAIGLGERVKFFGFIPPAQLGEILSQAKIGLHVLESKGLSYEYSLANKFFDYIQAGLPSVFTNLKEHKQFNATYNIGIMIETADAKLTADAINKLLNDTGLYQMLHENCLKAAPVLCWENEEKELLRIYEQLSTISLQSSAKKINDSMTQKDFYVENGLYVFTKSYLLKRGYCCENGCRHCPYKNKS